MKPTAATARGRKGSSLIMMYTQVSSTLQLSQATQPLHPAKVAAFTANEAGITQWVTPPLDEWLGRPLAALTGQPIVSWVMEEERPLLNEALARISREPHTVYLHLTGQSTEREFRWVLWCDPSTRTLYGVIEELTYHAHRSQGLARLSMALQNVEYEEELGPIVTHGLHHGLRFERVALYRYTEEGDFRYVAHAPQDTAPPFPAHIPARRAQRILTHTPSPMWASLLSEDFAPTDVALAVKHGQTPLGILIVNNGSSALSTEEQAMLEHAIATLAVAWQKALLLQAERAQAHVQRSLRISLMNFTQTLEPEALYRSIVTHVQNLEGVQAAALWTPQDEERWVRRAVQGTFTLESRPPSIPPAQMEGTLVHLPATYPRQCLLLERRGKPQGMLEVEWHTRPTTFQQEQLALLAAQAAVALENAHLFARVRREAQMRQVLFMASREIASASLEPEVVYRHMHKAVSALLGGNAFLLARYTPGEESLHIPYAYENGQRLPPKRLTLDEAALLGYVLRYNHPLLIRDLKTEARRVPIPVRPAGNTMRSIVVVPLLRHQVAIGAVLVQATKPHAFNEEHLALLQALASQMAVALENADLYEKTRRLAITDELTGVYNRRHLFALGTREIKRALRFQHPLTAVLLDLDDFKQINDRFGHAVGDEVLRLWARRISGGIREVDILGRYGGEEFGLFLPETQITDALHILRRLQHLIAHEPFQVSGQKIWVTMSIGVTAWQPEIQTASALLQRADAALYAAKNAGKNRIIWEDPHTHELRIEQP